MACVTLPIEERDCAIAAIAAEWAERFYAATSAIVADGSVRLESGVLDAGDLERIWLACLANERLREANDARRRSLLEDLVR